MSLGEETVLAMVQNQCYYFGIGAPPILAYFCGDWDVHWGYEVLTHGHLSYHKGVFFEVGAAFLVVLQGSQKEDHHLGVPYKRHMPINCNSLWKNIPAHLVWWVAWRSCNRNNVEPRCL